VRQSAREGINPAASRRAAAGLPRPTGRSGETAAAPDRGMVAIGHNGYVPSERTSPFGVHDAATATRSQSSLHSLQAVFEMNFRASGEPVIISAMNGGTGAVQAPGNRTPGPRAAGRGSGAGPVIRRWPLVSSLELAPLEGAPACGRGHVRNVLTDWGFGHLADDSELLASELLTNALKASAQASEPIRLSLLADSEQLIIEVWDHNPAIPQPRHPDYEDESGRGYMVIQAIANRWGCQRVSATLKVVWAEMLTGRSGT